MARRNDDAYLHPSQRIKHLCSVADAVHVESDIPIKRYFRSALELQRMAKTYYDEGNLENALILYLKFMSLFLEKLPTHPDFKSYNQQEKVSMRKQVKLVLPLAEKLKGLLLVKYSEEYENIIKEQRYLEEKLLQEKEEAEIKRFPKLENRSTQPNRNNESNFHSGDDMSLPHYHQTFSVKNNDDLDKLLYPMDALSMQSPEDPPPPYHSIADMPSPPTKSQPSPRRSAPSIDRTSKPSSLLSTKTEGLRPVIVPSNLLPLFMRLANSNTVNNIETCGVLAGKLAQNKLVITDLLIPKQCGTSDSCTTQNEEQLFDHQDKYNLITLGWIHTHPTQTAFLSSVDLHTHCSYQLMMPEALAIVCAPKYDDVGYFTLTPDYGLSYIANCKEGGFHPHPKEPPLFQSASHFILDNSAEVTIVDLRT